MSTTTTSTEMRDLIWRVHLAQWTPDRTCAISAHEWESLSDQQQTYLAGLAKLSSISIVEGDPT